MDPAAACLHCGARPRRFRALAHHLARLLFGVSAAVTLMACYADTSDYDCYNDPYCNGWPPVDAEPASPDAGPVSDAMPVPVATCLGEITCPDQPPGCPEGWQPAILDGCYTGDCLEDAVCAAEACALLDDAACTASEECVAIYGGINCTNPEGGVCTPDDECTCESFEFLSCVPAGT